MSDTTAVSGTDIPATTQDPAATSAPATQDPTAAAAASQDQGKTLLTQDASTPSSDQDGTTKEPEAVTGAPAEYADFTLPEGVTIKAEVLTGMKESFKGLNLTQEQAQGLIEFYGKTIVPDINATLTQTREATFEQWRQEITTDPELGGTKLGQTVTTAMKFVKEYPRSAELVKVFDETGIGNHPELIRFLHHFGSAMKEDTDFIQGKTAPNDLSHLPAVERLKAARRT